METVDSLTYSEEDDKRDWECGRDDRSSTKKENHTHEAVGYPDLDPEKIYEAIKDGTCLAIWRMITNATDMPCADFFDTVKDGVKEAMMELKESK